MASPDPVEEWQRLTDLYRGKEEEELLSLAQQYAELTQTAQQVLARELATRGLAMPQPEPELRGRREPEPDPDSPYADDRQLQEICKVWSPRDAKQLQDLLDRAQVPFYLDSPESGFKNGIKVQVMRIGVPLATAALKHYVPEDDPEQEMEPAVEGLAVHCPKCHSADIVFGDPEDEPEAEIPTTGSGFAWACATCGHRWNDDGVETS